MKKIILSLVIALVVVACQQAEVSVESTNTFAPPATTTETPQSTSAPTAFPTSELSPYYGEPQPAKIIVNGKTYDSEIGTTQWIKLDSEGRQYIEIGDAFAIITPKESVVVTSNLSFTLKLPIPINPTGLWYAIFPVTDDEIKSQDPKEGVFRWSPNYEQQPSLPLLVEQLLSFSFDPGFYVLEVHASWGGKPPHEELEADYGFLIEIQK